RAGDQRPRLSLDDSCRILAPVVLAVHFINAFQHTVLHHGDCAAWLYFLSELEEEGNTSFQRFPALIDSFQKGEQGTCMGIVTACMHYTVHCGSVRYILLILDWEGIEVRPDGNVWMRRIAECGEQAAAADISLLWKGPGIYSDVPLCIYMSLFHEMILQGAYAYSALFQSFQAEWILPFLLYP